MQNRIIECVNYIIKEYINDRKMQNWLVNNMIYYHNRLNNNANTKQAFGYVIQSPISIYTSNKDEEETIINTLWQVLEGKNHSITRVW